MTMRDELERLAERVVSAMRHDDADSIAHPSYKAFGRIAAELRSLAQRLPDDQREVMQIDAGTNARPGDGSPVAPPPSDMGGGKIQNMLRYHLGDYPDTASADGTIVEHRDAIAYAEQYAAARVAGETAALRAKLAAAAALVSRLGTSDQNLGSCVASSELHAACWEIRWPSTPEGFEEIKYHGANALQDYRDHVHPEARSREMVYKDEAIAYAAAKASQWEGVAGQAVSAEMAASLQAEQVERERDEARAEAERLRKDAERYALLRDSERCRELSGGRTGLILGNFDEDLDAEIDAAILAEWVRIHDAAIDLQLDETP